MLENVINGKWPGGNIPYGFYLGPDKHLHFNHEQISGVRLIFFSTILRAKILINRKDLE